MTLTKNVLVKLSFHAKMHKLLTYGHEYSKQEKDHHKEIKEQELKARLERSINTVTERIERKELAGKQDNELLALKKLALDLRHEFESMRKKN